MSVFLDMCKIKNIFVEYQREIKVYLNVCDDFKFNDILDILFLQIFRQQRKKFYELVLVCRYFFEMVKWYGVFERFIFFESEFINFCLVLQKVNVDRTLNVQFEEVYFVIVQVEVIEVSYYDLQI